MLVLSRKKNESIVINNGEISIHVVEIVGNRVRLGIKAPPEMKINRLEIHEMLLKKEEPAPDADEP